MPGTVYPKIEERRTELGTSKTRMAEYLDIDIKTLNNKLNGETEFSAREVKKLALWWGDSIDRLLETDDSGKEVD